MTWTIWLPGASPSLNRSDLHSHWAKFARLKKTWQYDLEVLLLAERVPRGLHAIHATAVLRFPKRRRRDEGNYRWLLEKALGDALQARGIVPDDTPEHFTFGEVTFDPAPGPVRTTITLTARPAQEAAA